MASVKKIRIQNSEVSAKEAFEYYNDELQHAIKAHYDRAILVLNKNIPADHQLWEWSLNWKNSFLESGKLLSILTGNIEQNNALNGIHLNEVKHPNQCSISHDLEKLYTDLNDTIKNIPKIDNSCKEIADSNLSTQQQMDYPVIAIKKQFKITGEYYCLACKKRALFMKGETAKNCTNDKCTYPQKGWKLTLELF